MNPFAGLIDQILADPQGPLAKPLKGKAIYRPVIVAEALRRPISQHDLSARYLISASTASNCLKEAGRAGLMEVVQPAAGGKPALWTKVEEKV
jgi:hypothetical protein